MHVFVIIGKVNMSIKTVWHSAIPAAIKMCLLQYQKTRYKCKSYAEVSKARRHTVLNVSLHRKSAFSLAMTLTSDLWPWKPFQQCPLTRWSPVQSFIEIRPVSEEIASRTDGRSAREHKPLAETAQAKNLTSNVKNLMTSNRWNILRHFNGNERLCVVMTSVDQLS